MTRSEEPPAPAGARPHHAVPRSLGDLLWELKQLHNIAVRLEERIGDLYWEFHRRQSPAGAATANDASRRPRPGASGRLRADALRASSAPVKWLENLTTEQRPDGSLLVSTDKIRVVLQPHLGALLLALAEDTGLSRDEGVGYKTLQDLSVRIGKLTGAKAPGPDTINKYICKLRKELCRSGLQGETIHTHRHLGRRLAVRRTPPAGA